MQLPAHIPVLSMRWNCSEPLSTVFPEDIAKYFRHFFPGFLALPAIQDYQIRHTGFPAWLAIRWPLATQDPAPLMHSQHLWDVAVTTCQSSSSSVWLLLKTPHLEPSCTWSPASQLSPTAVVFDEGFATYICHDDITLCITDESYIYQSTSISWSTKCNIVTRQWMLTTLVEQLTPSIAKLVGEKGLRNPWISLNASWPLRMGSE